MFLVSCGGGSLLFGPAGCLARAMLGLYVVGPKARCCFLAVRRIGRSGYALWHYNARCWLASWVGFTCRRHTKATAHEEALHTIESRNSRLFSYDLVILTHHSRSHTSCRKVWCLSASLTVSSGGLGPLGINQHSVRPDFG